MDADGRKRTKDESNSSPVRKLSKMSDDHSEQNSMTNETMEKESSDGPPATPEEYDTEPFLELPEDSNVPKKIGFIGMGMMGQIILKHLLNSGYDVSIWNPNAENGFKLVDAGAQICPSPSEVIRNSDIVFSCVPGPDVVKSFVYLDEGVLQGLKTCEYGSKGYVELTFMDTTTSREIAEAINFYGGKYLKANIYGSERLAEERSLLILCSGNLELFEDCENCFTTFSEFVCYSSRNTFPPNILMDNLNGELREAVLRI
ncbi:putative oxidoreductase GLYR1 [Trichonephila clavata]|uniref:Putative oxidoreductase GLYR1 n=1 Tax=Trichonephila clavata TaxID=2740835 RepID=A0A8X6L4B8_TRICU|nr:putative oxidoreductase GLYR1 [Trichonephila clavata]